MFAYLYFYLALLFIYCFNNTFFDSRGVSRVYSIFCLFVVLFYVIFKRYFSIFVQHLLFVFLIYS